MTNTAQCLKCRDINVWTPVRPDYPPLLCDQRPVRFSIGSEIYPNLALTIEEAVVLAEELQIAVSKLTS